MKKLTVQHSKQTGLAALLVGASLASVLPLAAQDVGGYEGIEQHSTVEGGFRVGVGFGYRTDADIDDHNGEFNETRGSVTGMGIISVNDKWTFNPILSYRFSLYDFSDGPDGDLWDDIHTVRFTPLVQYKLDEKWTIFGGPSAGFSAESDADITTAWTFGAIAGVRYKVSETLTVGGGLGVFSQIEDDPSILPLLIVNWQITERLDLRAGFSEVAAAGGLGAELGYKLNEKWTVGGGLQFQKKRFRLSEDSSAPAPDGVGEDTSVPIYAKVGWHPSTDVALELMAGINAAGNVRVEDDDGDKLADEDYDPSAIFGVRLLFNF
jgi:hypothetical protein